MATLLLVRHCRVESERPGQFWGHTDVPLSAEGLSQAARLRDRLARERITAAYCSDLSRATRTAEIVLAPHRIEASRCRDLREIDFGRCEGLEFEEIQHRYPECESAWTGVDPELRWPGGEGLADLDRRVGRFSDSRILPHAADDTVLIVAHGGSLRVLICRLLGIELSRWCRIWLDHASLSIMQTVDDGAILSRLNDTCHLASQ